MRSIPYGKGKAEEDDKKEDHECHVSIPYGKGKVQPRFLKGVVEQVSIPYGKGKVDYDWVDISNILIYVSIPYGKGKDL